MGAFRADGEELVADAGEDDRLPLDMASEEPVLVNVANRDAKRQIGSGLLFITCRHGTLLMGAPASGQSSPAPAACSCNGVSAGRFPQGFAGRWAMTAALAAATLAIRSEERS